jgi:signal transduction histidine kinase/DNA-binding response OmpR family regulator
MKTGGCVTISVLAAALAAVLACIAMPPSAWGEGTCLLRDGVDEYDLRPFMDVLDDPERILTITQAASPSVAGQFGPPARGHFNFGFTSSALWFRFTIAREVKNSAHQDASSRWVLDPGWNVYETVQLFIPDAGAPGGWVVHSAGNRLCETGGPDRRHFLLPENIEAPLTCYLRVTGIRPIMVSPLIATIERTMWVNSLKVLGTGLVLGYFLTMAFGHLFVWLYAGIDKFKWSIPGNLGFASFVALTSYQHLVNFQNLTELIMIVGLVTQGFLALVIRAVMDTRIHSRILDTLLLGSVFLVFTAAVVGPFLPEHLHGSISMRVVMPVAFIGAWACVANLKRNRTVSIIFLVAWGGTVLETVLYNRTANGGAPFTHPMMMWFGFIAEALAMAFLLAYFTSSISAQRQAAEALARAKSTFLASMSHEIRTPMTSILGFLNLAMQSGATGQLRQYLLKIQASARHLLGIINDILDVSKIEEGKVGLESRPFEVERLLRETGDILVPRAFENGDELVVSIGPGVPRRIVGDPLRLQQVLVNLGGNAVKFTRRGMVRIAVSRAGDARVEAGSVDLVFQVADTGVGIEAEVLPRLFQSFEQADRSTTRVFGGTGLGLNISRRLVQLMGGDISVRSTPGHGSVFEFAVSFDVPAETPLQTASSFVEYGCLRALVVEDNPASLSSMEEILSDLGVRFRSAGTAAEAVRLAGEERFDLVLLDWDLPDLTAPEAAARLDAACVAGQTPVVIMSSLARPEMEGARPGQFGAQGILAKPFTSSMVEGILRGIVLRQGVSEDEGEALRAEERRNLEEVRGMRVLVVDDNPFNRELFDVMLRQAGVELETLRNGRDAVARILNPVLPLPDVVLMDLHMPEMDGYEAARRIRKDPRCSSLPILALTADVVAENEALCLAAGMNERLTKPVDAATLFAALVAWKSQTLAGESVAGSFSAGGA